jgi:O-antigen ligase
MSVSTGVYGNETRPTGRALVAALLILALFIAPLTGVLISYIALLITLVGIAFLLGRRQHGVWLVDEMAIILAGAFALLTVCFAFSANELGDMRYALNFLALLLYVPIASLLTRAASPRATTVVAWLAFAGATLGAVYSVGEILFTNASRAGWLMPQNDPIRVANTALLLGFLCLIGLRQQTGRWRLLLLAGPFLGLAAVIACGSRTAMVAFAVLLFWVALWLAQNWKWRVAICAILAVALIGVVTSGVIQSERLSSLILSVQEILTNQPLTDKSMDIRMSLYRAALEAFGGAPLFGYGWAGMMDAIAPLLPEVHAVHAEQPHLHNELLNFALSTGIVGVFAFVALLAGPLITAIRSTPDSQKHARIFGCSILVVGYVVMGSADTMISYETHTALYVLWSAILLGYCRDTPKTVVVAAR